MANMARGRRGLVPADNREIEVHPVELPALEELAPDLINPADDRKEGRKKFLVQSQRIWASLSSHPTTSALTETQMWLLFSAVCAWDMGMKGRATFLMEGRRILESFGVSPEAVARRRIDLVAADEAEDRRDERRGRSAQGPRQVPEFRPRNMLEGQ